MNLSNLVRSSALCLLTAATSMQARPAIQSVEPRTGPTVGGTVVTIRGTGFATVSPAGGRTVPQCTPCPPRNPHVTFGDKPAAEIRSFTDTEIVAVTPPNAGGVYDLAISTDLDGEERVVQERAFQYGTNRNDRILIPLVADRIPGAFDSVWSTELVGRNDNDTAIYISQLDELINDVQGLGKARSTFRPELENNGAAFLYHRHIGPGSSLTPPAFNLRVRDLSRQADSWGVEIPIIRTEDAFVNRTMYMLNVPYESESRLTLRIYDLDGEVGGSVPVHVFDEATSAPLGSKVLYFPAGPQLGPTTPYLDYPKVPGFIIVDLATIGGPQSLNGGPVRVQVGEKNLPKRLWSMISVTDLETQQVTIITPQK